MNKMVLVALVCAAGSMAGPAIGLDGSVSLRSRFDRHEHFDNGEVRGSRRGDVTVRLAPGLRIPLRSRWELCPYLALEMGFAAGEHYDEEGRVYGYWNDNHGRIGLGSGLYYALVEQGRLRVSAGPHAGFTVVAGERWFWLHGGGVVNLDIQAGRRLFFRMGQRFLFLDLGLDTRDAPDKHTIFLVDWVAAQMQLGMFLEF